jgi:hypothetical protein
MQKITTCAISHSFCDAIVDTAGGGFCVDTVSAVKPSQNIRHCERSEAIHVAAIPAVLDCFVASLLATTGLDLG